jgi:hypothetical protein
VFASFPCFLFPLSFFSAPSTFPFTFSDHSRWGIPNVEVTRKVHQREAHSPVMNPFNSFGKSPNEPLSQVYTIDRDWVKWVSLNHDVDALPAEISLYKDHPERDWSNEQTLESGRYKDLEWACEPDWFRIDTWWRGWIPTGGGSDFNPWYLDLDTLLPYVIIDDRFAFNEEIKARMKLSIEELQTGVDALIVTRILDCDLPGPPRYDTSILDGTFPTLRDLRVESANAKRAALDRAGWIRWWANTVPDSYFAAPTCVQDLLHFGLSDAFIYRGFVIDLCRDWQAFDISLCLHYHVPIFYAWGFDERNDERFCRLHPRLLELSEDGQSLDHPTESLPINDELTRAAAASWKYDDYLTNIYSQAPTGLSTYDSHSTFTVIDFEGWGRRRIEAKLAPSYASKFHFTTSTDEVTGDPVVVFWRWRPREVPDLEDLPARDETRSQLLERQSGLWVIRGIFAQALAPSITRRFNVITGALEHDNSSSLERRLAKRAWDSSSQREDDDMMSIDAVNERGETSTRPLTERIEGRALHRRERGNAARPSLSNITTWKNFSERARSQRSRSPARRYPLVNTLPPRERPARMFRDAFREIAGKLTYTETLFTQVDVSAWNGQYLVSGYLHVPDWRAQIRMRFFANCLDSVNHIYSILSIAIEHKLSFQIGIRVEDFRFFHTDTISVVDQRLLKTMYKPGFIETPFSYTSPSAFLNAYMGKMADILRRPHARAFIGLGGPFSWLAQRWGGEELVARFMEGPSIQVTRHFSGQTDSGEDQCLGIHWDRVSDQEVEFLFGYIPADKWNPERWLYPPVSILEESCDHWSGEWNIGMEEIFRHVTSQVTRNPPTAAPKSRRGWMDFLRSYNRGRKAPAFVATERHFLDAKRGIQVAGLPANWNRQKISSLVIPEYSIL